VVCRPSAARERKEGRDQGPAIEREKGHMMRYEEANERTEEEDEVSGRCENNSRVELETQKEGGTSLENLLPIRIDALFDQASLLSW
jgi:hypothetical protein